MVTEDAPSIWQEVKVHLEAEEWQEVAASGHKLKGMLSTFDTGTPIPELQEMIAAARRERVSEVNACFDNCRRDVERLIQEVAELGAMSTNGC